MKRFERQVWERRGAQKYKISCYREREGAIRLKVLEAKGHVCEACGFDFALQYDSKPSAHVHHKQPLALGERLATSIDEFAVLCGPCHTAAHMGEGRLLNPWTIEELQARIRKRWTAL